MRSGMALLTWEEMKAEQDRRRLKREANALEDGMCKCLACLYSLVVPDTAFQAKFRL